MGKNWKFFFQGRGQDRDDPSHHCYFHIVLEVLDTAIRQQKEIRGIQIGKEEVELLLFVTDMMLSIKHMKDFHKNC